MPKRPNVFKRAIHKMRTPRIKRQLSPKQMDAAKARGNAVSTGEIGYKKGEGFYQVQNKKTLFLRTPKSVEKFWTADGKRRAYTSTQAKRETIPNRLELTRSKIKKTVSAKFGKQGEMTQKTPTTTLEVRKPTLSMAALEKSIATSEKIRPNIAKRAIHAIRTPRIKRQLSDRQMTRAFERGTNVRLGQIGFKKGVGYFQEKKGKSLFTRTGKTITRKWGTTGLRKSQEKVLDERRTIPSRLGLTDTRKTKTVSAKFGKQGEMTQKTPKTVLRTRQLRVAAKPKAKRTTKKKTTRKSTAKKTTKKKKTR